MPSLHRIAVAVLTVATAAHAQWDINFWTTHGCTVNENYTRIGYSGYSGENDTECVTIGNPDHDCYLLTQGSSGTNIQDCVGPDSKGLAGNKLLSIDGARGSCDYYTDLNCTKGKFHHDMVAYTGLFGFPDDYCFTGYSYNLQTVRSFRCSYTGSSS